jgi:hypothetical protein
MNYLRGLFQILLLTTSLFAQDAVPAGTILPVHLGTTLDSKKCRVGQVISGTIMQDVPLAPGDKLRAGTQIRGRVLEVEKTSNGVKLTFVFDRVRTRKQEIPVLTNARAIASYLEVTAAGIPNISDAGPEWDWTTVQIGGDVVYGGPDRVEAAGKLVGHAVKNGVVAQVSAVPNMGCRGAIDGNDEPQAFWLFSSSACGLYGYEDLTIAHAGRSNPEGQIVLVSPVKIHIAAGSGMLLRVNPVLH